MGRSPLQCAVWLLVLVFSAAMAAAQDDVHGPEKPHAKIDPLVAEFRDALPVPGMLPRISSDDVERWIALGTEASRRGRAADVPGAEAAYRAQIAIYRGNGEPFFALAMLEAGQGNDKNAVDLLRAAVARGYTDLDRAERAEAATRLRGGVAMQHIRDMLPQLRREEEEFAAWDGFHFAGSRPANEVLASHLQFHERIALIAPVLGTRQVRLWKRLIDRSTAAELEVYVAQHKDAPDLDDALARLMAIYAERTVLDWVVLPAAAATRLSAAAGLVLARGSNDPLRPGALACAAVAQNANRDGKGVLKPASAEWIRSALSEVLTRYPTSDFAELAAVGLVRVEAEQGRMDRAAAVYADFRLAHAADDALLTRTQDGLGDLALRAGGIPEFRATALDGTVLTGESLKGKVTVIDFWETSCVPCVERLATLRRLEGLYGDRVVLVGVVLDGMAESALREWLVSRDVPGHHVQSGWDSELARAFGVRQVPFRVVARDRTVLSVNEADKKLEKRVAEALDRKGARP
ncbi:MAG TPA: redoxin family protein [Candidatus Polarisedimenticolaceae bacterium]|nr:redoxin family protein [Candidatus Polarisedimenticolaceae bacterium]